MATLKDIARALDLSITQTDPVMYGICKTPVAAGPGSGGLSYGIVPGAPDASILVFRMTSTQPQIRMPELGRNLVHDEGLAHLSQWLIDQKVTIYHSTPTFFRHFTGTLPAGLVFPGIRLVIMGGEETVKADVLAYRAHFRHIVAQHILDAVLQGHGGRRAPGAGALQMQGDDAAGAVKALEDDVAAIVGDSRANAGRNQFLDLGDDLFDRPGWLVDVELPGEGYLHAHFGFRVVDPSVGNVRMDLIGQVLLGRFLQDHGAGLVVEVEEARRDRDVLLVA